MNPYVNLGRDVGVAGGLVDQARREWAVEQRLYHLCTIPLTASKRALLSRVMGWLGSSEAALAGLHLIDDTCSPAVPHETWKQIEGIFCRATRSHGKDSNAYTRLHRGAQT